MPIPEKEENLQRISAKNMIYQSICTWIIEGTMLPGEKLNDAQLANHFNVSRTPVREALQLLEAQKLIQVIPGRATVVTEIDKGDLEKCYRPLAEIQGLAARMASNLLTEQELTSLENIHEDFVLACDNHDAKKVIEYDGYFHELIMAAANNSYMTDFSQMMMLHIQRIKYHYFHNEPMRKISARHHKAILETLKRRDGEAAQNQMREHWLYVMERCLEDIETKETQN